MKMEQELSAQLSGLGADVPESPYDKIADTAQTMENRARKCAMGDLESMVWMFEHFRSKLSHEFKKLETRVSGASEDDTVDALKAHFENNDEDAFYFHSSSLWLIRAAIYGSKKAEQLLEKYPGSRYGYFKESLQRPGNDRHWGDAGTNMRRMGFLDFAENVDYIMESLNNRGIYVGYSYVGYDGADETGFGMEEEYDYYFFDEFFRLLFILHGWSSRDVRTNEDRISSACEAARAEKQKEREQFWVRYKNEAGMERYTALIQAMPEAPL